jgi:hypothetical protein
MYDTIFTHKDIYQNILIAMEVFIIMLIKRKLATAFLVIAVMLFTLFLSTLNVKTATISTVEYTGVLGESLGNLTITINNNIAVLRWSPYTGVTEYQVQISTNGKLYENLGSTAVPLFTYDCARFTGTYYLKIVATRGTNKSAFNSSARIINSNNLQKTSSIGTVITPTPVRNITPTPRPANITQPTSTPKPMPTATRIPTAIPTPAAAYTQPTTTPRAAYAQPTVANPQGSGVVGPVTDGRITRGANQHTVILKPRIDGMPKEVYYVDHGAMFYLRGVEPEQSPSKMGISAWRDDADATFYSAYTQIQINSDRSFLAAIYHGM